MADLTDIRQPRGCSAQRRSSLDPGNPQIVQPVADFSGQPDWFHCRFVSV